MKTPTGMVLVEAHSEDKQKRLLGLGDVHHGSPCSDTAAFKKAVDYAKKEGAWVILMGDLLECATQTSVGAGWVEQVLDPQTQLNEMVEMLKPIDKQILGLFPGNHELRIWKSSGINVASIMAQLLGVKYLGYSAFFKLKVKEQEYKVYATHGASNARLPYTKIKACLDLARFADADAFLMGHTHELNSYVALYRSVQEQIVTERRKVFCLTGSFLRWEGSYAEMKLLVPSKTGYANLILLGDRWDIHCVT